MKILNLILKYFLLLKIVLHKSFEAEADDKCLLWKEKHVFNNTELHSAFTSLLVVFENFEEFNIDCQNISFNPKVLKFYAKRKINFENGINLEKMLSHFNLNSDSDKSIIIQNIKGFNANSERILLESQTSNKIDFIVYLNDLNFDFYINNSFISQDMCDTKYFIERKISFFGQVKSVDFNDDIFYRKDTCPFVFTNTQVEELGLSKITNSLIFKNQLEFLDLNETKGFEMNLKKMRYFRLGIFNEDITLKILNKFIFKHMFSLEIIGSINRIEDDLFCSFKQIQILSLILDDLKSFFQNGIEWMKHLNENLNSTKKMVFVRILENMSPFKREYQFPSEDLCLFKEFPHDQLIFPLISAKKRRNCSCTVLWLLKNYDVFYKSPQFRFFYGIDDEDLTMKYCSLVSSTQCNFDEKFKYCGNITNPQSNSLGVYHDFLQFEWLKLIINVYFQTIFSIFGFIFNLLIIIVLTNKKHKKNFNNLMYKHIYFNALFNTLFCLIKSLSLINICIFPRTSFCSSIYKFESSQYFRIIVGLFLGNSFKLCCNISYILFALSRFSVTTSSQSAFLKRLNDLNVRKCYALVIFISVCFSSFKLFEYKPNEIYAYFDKNFPYNIFDVKYCQSSNTISQYFTFKCILFPILNLINNVFNNVLFVIICVLVDIFLARFTNKSLKKKLALLVDEKHKNEAIMHRNKITKMILINGTIYILSHVPAFVITILLIIFKNDLADFCFYYISFTELMDIPESFCLISICLQFFIFIRFDQNFEISFLEIVKDFIFF
jgi:hypothetical protein